MGKLIRNGIEYGGGNGTDIFEVDQDTYDTLKAQDKLVHNALYVLTDAPNLNATSEDLSYDGGATSTHDVIEQATGYNDSSILCTATVTEPTLTNGTSVNHRTYYYKKEIGRAHV